MATLSVPIPHKLEDFIKNQIKKGNAPNKAAVVRRALIRLSEEEAINDVLRSEQEMKEGKLLKGDLRKLLKQLKK